MKAAKKQPVIQIFSFGFRQGDLPERTGTVIVDVRKLADPYSDEELRPLDGRHPAVQKFVADQKVAQQLVRKYALAIGDGTITAVAFGCHGGRHRSVAMAETLAQKLNVYPWHLDLRRCREVYSPKAKGDYSHMPEHMHRGFTKRMSAERFQQVVAGALNGVQPALPIQRMSHGVLHKAQLKLTCNDCDTEFYSDVVDACPDCDSTDVKVTSKFKRS